MHQLGLVLGIILIADGSAARLEVLKIAAGGNLHIAAVAGHPHLNIIGLGTAEAQVAGGKHHHAVGQAQQLQYALRIVGQLFQLGIAFLGLGKFHQFHFVKLVLPDQAAGIPAGAACLAAEAGGVRTEAHRQLAAIQNIAAVHIGHRYLSSGDQVVIQPLQLVHIFRKFGQLPGAGHAVLIGNKGRENLGIAVGAVGIHKKGNDAALQPAAQPAVEVEPFAGHLSRSLRVQDPQVGADIPVRQRLVIKVGRLAPAAQLHIFGVIFANRWGCWGSRG